MIEYEPQGIAARHRNSETLLDCARRNSVTIASACGGRGICRTCVIQYLDDNAPKPTAADQQFFSASKIAKGWRRACQTIPSASARIHVPAKARVQSTRHSIDSADIWVQPDPAVRMSRVSMDEPSGSDNRDDAKRLLDAVNLKPEGSASRIDIRVLQALPSTLRDEKWKVQAAVRFDEIIAVLPAKAKPLGLAIDLGTTNIAVMLVDLHSGNTLATQGIENPQVKFGNDLVARISFIKRHPETLVEMQSLVVSAINEVAQQLCNKRKLSTNTIVDVVVAGNTVMHHVLLGLPVSYLAVSPFTATAQSTDDVKTRDLGFNFACGSYVHVMHNIGGYVGGDHIAMLLGIRADQEQRSVLALDIGTNTEISLIHQGGILSLSCPSGPALEGGNISCGMRAAKGAIEKITCNDDQIQITTIDNEPAIGLCGSAVLDALASYYEVGAINVRGQVDESSIYTIKDGDHDMIEVVHSQQHLVYFTQQDVRNVQLAKGAIRAGCEILMEKAGINAEQLDRIVIAGAFGLFIDLNSAINIGMLPKITNDKFEQIGNAAGMGAKLALISYPLRMQANQLAIHCQYLEQAGTRAFMRLFMANINLPEKPLKT